jgi:hypothetical protein
MGSLTPGADLGATDRFRRYLQKSLTVLWLPMHFGQRSPDNPSTRSSPVGALRCASAFASEAWRRKTSVTSLLADSGCTDQLVTRSVRVPLGLAPVPRRSPLKLGSQDP